MPITGQETVASLLRPTREAAEESGNTLKSIMRDHRRNRRPKRIPKFKYLAGCWDAEKVEELRKTLPKGFSVFSWTPAGVTIFWTEESHALQLETDKLLHALRGDFPVKESKPKVDPLAEPAHRRDLSEEDRVAYDAATEAYVQSKYGTSSFVGKITDKP